jgi:excinuclease UvrABC helicase subunit UvrB
MKEFGNDFNQKNGGRTYKYFTKFGIRTRYIHSDVETLERIQIMQDLRLGLLMF